MSNRNPRAKWVLPTIVNPGTSICIQVPVPNDELHLAAFKGAIWNLCSAANWQDDTAHTAVDVANVWRDIFFDLENCDMSNWTVRLNPTDCTEVQQFDNEIMDYADVFSLRCAVDTVIGEVFPPTNPPAPGQPGPQPGGGSPNPGECFTLKIRVNGYAPSLIPINIASGWTINASIIDGATTDGFLAQFPPYISLWRCGDGGGLYQLGTCFGSPEQLTTDPMPTENHLIPIIQFPDSTYAALHRDDPVTVPDGMADGFYQVLINNSPNGGTNPGAPAGELILTIEACAPGSSHIYDFTLSDCGFSPDNSVATQNPEPIWISGDGWTANTAQVGYPETNVWDFIFKQLSSDFHMVKMIMTYERDAVGTPGALQQVGVDAYSDNHRASVSTPPTGSQTLTYTPSGGLDTDRMYCVATYGSLGSATTIRIKKLQVFITGTPPTW